MGNTSNSLSSNRPLKEATKFRKSLQKVVGYVYDDPDVETLRIPFDAARNIFLRLSFSDLFNCMLVCKEWRSLINTCSFWDDYLHANFDFDLVEVKKTSPLYDWKYGVSRKTVFKPFPDTWACDLVVPHGMLPPQGCLDIYHSFIAALIWTRELRKKLEDTPVSHPMDTCLIPWHSDRMPSQGEVLSILGGDSSFLKGIPEAKPFSKQEMRNYLSIMNGRYSSSQLDAILYRWIADRVFDRVILFECNPLVIKPTPSFIVTRLAPGWVGGLIYSR